MGSTWRGGTRITRHVLQDSNGHALQEGIAGESVQAKTHWSVLAHIADGIDAANGSGAGIHALVVDAGQGLTAIRVDVALRLAAGLRISQISGQAGADSAVIQQLALTVSSTRTGHAGIRLGMIQSIAAHSRVSSQS